MAWHSTFFTAVEHASLHTQAARQCQDWKGRPLAFGWQRKLRADPSSRKPAAPTRLRRVCLSISQVNFRQPNKTTFQYAKTRVLSVASYPTTQQDTRNFIKPDMPGGKGTASSCPHRVSRLKASLLLTTLSICRKDWRQDRRQGRRF